MENSSIPPISSPFGSGAPTPQLPLVGVENANTIRIYEKRSASVGILLRVNIKGMFCTPHTVLMFISLFPLMPIIAAYAIATELKRLRIKTPVITLARTGVRFISNSEEKFAFWNDVTHIVERNGDVFIIAPPLYRNIAREDFASRDEAREFVAIARELKNGGAWREQWNGRTFGVHSDDDGARNNPR